MRLVNRVASQYGRLDATNVSFVEVFVYSITTMGVYVGIASLGFMVPESRSWPQVDDVPLFPCVYPHKSHGGSLELATDPESYHGIPPNQKPAPHV